MYELEPESAELMAFYQANIEHHRKIADGCRIPKFSRVLRHDLLAFLPSLEAVDLVEVVTRMGDFGNMADLVSMRKAVSRLLKTRGVSLSRGKRTGPGLLEFVARVAPVLLFFGVPLATGGRSKLVRALQMIAAELDLLGDPRDELRRLQKKKAKLEAAQQQLMADLLTKAKRHLAPPSQR